MRKASEDTVIVADGFSCRGQIEQLTDRKAVHTAQLLQMAREHGPQGPAGPRPEQAYADAQLPVPWTRKARSLAIVVAGAALLLFVGSRLRRPR